jgi:hypothetical protein
VSTVRKRLASKKRGVASNRRIATPIKQKFVALIREHYSDFGPELASEYLRRNHGVVYSVETLRTWE